MPDATIWGHDGTSFKGPNGGSIQNISVKDSGSWKNSKGVWIKDKGTWHTVVAPSTAHSVTQSIVFDGTNDGARFLDTGATAPISQIFNSDNGGGTVAMAFRTNGTTSYTNSYMIQAGWGGGWNWLLWLYPWDDNEYNKI